MIRIKLLVTLSFTIMVMVCRAQTDSVSKTDTTQKTATSYSLNYFHYYYLEFSFRRFASHNRTLSETDVYNSESLRLNKGYSDDIFSRRKTFVAPDDYNRLKKPDYYYNSDPSNPFGTTSGRDALIYGSANYLFGKLFSDK